MQNRSPAVAIMAVVATWFAAGTACSPNERVADEPFPVAEELMAADRAFARASAERGAEAWTEVFAARGLMYGSGESPAIGPLEAGRSVSGVVDRLRWEPTSSGMLWPGTLGYTVGRWWLAPGTGDPGADGPRYLTVWQRVGDEWKVALDLSLPAPGDTGAAHDFDFWLGDWTLAQRIWSGDGNQFEPYAARNQVRAVEGDGALIETFEGEVRFFWLGMPKPQQMRGASIRVYNPDSRQWRIFWIDTLDPKFGAPFSGDFSGVAGEFVQSDRPAGIPPSRIRFEPHTEGTVDWELAIRTPDGKDWQRLWTIEFRRGDEI
ncbi:MAG: nuclear transport factor 2 family protein [Woeseiaceae bacterium]